MLRCRPGVQRHTFPSPLFREEISAGAGGGGGGSSSYPLAVAVIGGVISSTLLTLVVIPVAYSLLGPWLRINGAGEAQ